MATENLTRIPFDLQDEAQVRGAADWMRIAGVIAMLSGLAFCVLLVLDPNWMSFLSGPPVVLLGTQLWRAGTAFRRVADTDDADQEQIVVGLEAIREFFLAKVMLVGFALVFVIFHGLLASI